MSIELMRRDAGGVLKWISPDQQRKFCSLLVPGGKIERSGEGHTVFALILDEFLLQTGQLRGRIPESGQHSPLLRAKDIGIVIRYFSPGLEPRDDGSARVQGRMEKWRYIIQSMNKEEKAEPDLIVQTVEER